MSLGMLLRNLIDIHTYIKKKNKLLGGCIVKREVIQTITIFDAKTSKHPFVELTFLFEIPSI